MEQDTMYYISEAAKRVQVETHVLRYWEDELELPIRRNEMGHRYYTNADIEKLREIKILKEQGLQLKAIKNILVKGEGDMFGKAQKYIVSLTKGGKDVECQRVEENTDDKVKIEEVAAWQEKEGIGDAGQEKPEEKVMAEDNERDSEIVQAVPVLAEQTAPAPELDKSGKAARLQYLLQHIITEAVRTANEELCNDVKDSILKELDYQFRMQEERDEERWKQEEEHYRKIDEMIRERHNTREKLKKGKRKSPVSL